MFQHFMNCDYCGTDTTNTYHDNVDGALHKSCRDERYRREDNQLCVFCGIELGEAELEIEDIKHERCRLAGTFSGYPYQ